MVVMTLLHVRILNAGFIVFALRTILPGWMSSNEPEVRPTGVSCLIWRRDEAVEETLGHTAPGKMIFTLWRFGRDCLPFGG
jgi:hypothetical protein